MWIRWTFDLKYPTLRWVLWLNNNHSSYFNLNQSNPHNQHSSNPTSTRKTLNKVQSLSHLTLSVCAKSFKTSKYPVRKRTRRSTKSCWRRDKSENCTILDPDCQDCSGTRKKDTIYFRIWWMGGKNRRRIKGVYK